MPPFDQLAYLYEDARKPFFRREGGRLVPNRPMSRARELSAEKTPGLPRVFVVGGAFSPPLRPPPGDPGLELVDCRMGQYDSPRVAALARELVSYQPDLMIVVAGWNEGVPARPRRRSGEPVWSYRALAAAYDERRWAALLDQTLGAVARAAAKEGVPLVFCTSARNFADLPPWRPAPWDDADFLAGRRALDAGRLAQAEARLRRLRGDPAALFVLGQALRRRGKTAAARRTLLAALEAGGLGRMTPGRNAVVRAAARSAGAGLVDLEKLAARLSPGGLVGFEVLREDAHWREELLPRVYDEVFGSPGVRRRIGRVPLWGRRPYPDPRAASRWQLGAAEWLETGRWVSRRAFWERSVAYFERGLAEDEGFRLGADALAPLRRVERRDAFAEPYLRDLDKEGAALRAHLAEALRRRGRAPEAARALEGAPDDPLVDLELSLLG